MQECVIHEREEKGGGREGGMEGERKRERESRGRGSPVATSLASHQGEQGSIRVTPDFRMWESCRTMAVGRRGFFFGDLPFPPSLHSGSCSIPTSIILIGSQDLAASSPIVQSAVALFTAVMLAVADFSSRWSLPALLVALNTDRQEMSYESAKCTAVNGRLYGAGQVAASRFDTNNAGLPIPTRHQSIRVEDFITFRSARLPGYGRITLTKIPKASSATYTHGEGPNASVTVSGFGMFNDPTCNALPKFQYCSRAALLEWLERSSPNKANCVPAPVQGHSRNSACAEHARTMLSSGGRVTRNLTFPLSLHSGPLLHIRLIPPINGSRNHLKWTQNFPNTKWRNVRDSYVRYPRSTRTKIPDECFVSTATSCSFPLVPERHSCWPDRQDWCRIRHILTGPVTVVYCRKTRIGCTKGPLVYAVNQSDVDIGHCWKHSNDGTEIALADRREIHISERPLLTYRRWQLALAFGTQLELARGLLTFYKYRKLRQKAKSKYRNRIRLERASQKRSSDTHKTPYDRVKRCRECKINTKASERVNVDVFTQNKRPRPQHSHAPFFNACDKK
ncbi:hypothetical protein PR048_007180 [Dryococelus australis]|uniref:Peptidase S1 domain-containing protein n=1 Tax=Dryococelus australis TaxID=614101 RepID=A0ABQ9ICY6_9NEOP|nr:hypothetical protein PR048_007180 [Dryococelus australis]